MPTSAVHGPVPRSRSPRSTTTRAASRSGSSPAASRAAGLDDPRAPAGRARAPRPRPAAARLRAPRARGHVRLLRRPAERRRAPTSASSSSTTPATRPRAGTGRSRSSRGRSTKGSSRGARARTGSSSTCPPAGSRPGRGCEDGRVRSVRFRNVPAFVWARGRRASAAARVDVAFGGAFYASLEERVEPRELPRLIELGRELKRVDRGVAGRRPPARARAPRRLRGDLLAGGGREPR